MASSMSRLPSRFPVGTKFVIEGTRREGQAQVFTRYIEFPDGTHIALPKRSAPSKTPAPKATAVGRKRRAGAAR
ncbi:MAG: hypothetical protein Q8M26_17175 [Pseudolabrys sp.]|nr:hypothetical protein [Pseudolabrys sp.]